MDSGCLEAYRQLGWLYTNRIAHASRALDLFQTVMVRTHERGAWTVHDDQNYVGLCRAWLLRDAPARATVEDVSRHLPSVDYSDGLYLGLARALMDVGRYED